MIVVADASFLVAAFAPSDDHNREAWNWWQQWDASVVASRLALFEAENSVRGFAVAGKCSVAETRRSLEGLNLDPGMEEG